MAHEVETMAYAGEIPWHGIGTLVKNPADAVSPQRFMELAGLDWEVTKVPVFAHLTAESVPTIKAAGPIDSLDVETNHGAIVRRTDGRVLGVVGPGYVPLQNRSVFEWFAPFLESGRVAFEAGGSLREGAIIWALARVIGLNDLIREGDRVVNYMLLTHGHDGMHAVLIGFTPTRVVCANTLAAAKAHRDSQLIRAKHTSGLQVTLERVRDIMDVAEVQFRATIDQYRLLASCQVNESDVRKYVKVVVDAPKDEERISPAMDKKIDRMVELTYSGRGNSGKDLWDAYNGVTEYLTWEASKTTDNRFRSLWFGQGSQMSQKALEVGVEMAMARA